MNLSDINFKLFTKRLFLVLGAIFVFTLQSCTDEWGINSGNDEFNENEPGITFYIPNIDYAAEYGATRSDEFANTRAYDQAKEGNFNTLYIAAVNENGKVFTFLKTTSNGIDEDGYLKYRVNLNKGTYRFYIVANLNRYTLIEDNASATFADIATSEENIRKHILNFSASTPLEPGFLPMACLNEEIYIGRSRAEATKNENKDSYVDVPAKNGSGESLNIYADLKFLCSKVRYTILFDRDQSEFKGSDDIINFNRNTTSNPPFVSNLRTQTAINNTEDKPKVEENFLTDNSGKPSQWTLFLDRFIYPKDNNGNIEYSISKNDLKDLLKKGLTQWVEGNDWNTTYADARAWQGITYLPENLLDGEGEKTFLNFPYTINNQTGANSPRAIELFSNGVNGDEEDVLKRSMMYDVVVFVKSTDPAQWQINVIPSQWTLQELAYQLHGPYELIVETSIVEKISMEEEAVFWYRSDVPPEQIGFISPEVSTSGNEGEDMAPLFIGGVMKDDNGNYVKNENGDYLFHVGMNLDIPYDVIDKLNRLYAEGNDGNKYNKSDISFFHIVAGSLQKRIEIKDLDLNPYLKVTPQTFIIDTRELYTSTKDDIDFDIFFETNVDPNETSITLVMEDPSKLVADGVGEGALKISNPEGYKNNGTTYNLTKKTGKFQLNIKDIITGNPYWNLNNEYTLKFILTVHREGLEDFIVEKDVIIKVRPFSGSYVIHFRDNTRPWEDPHIYVYQDLILPSDLKSGYDSNGEWRDNSEFAGRIVGYIERNPSSGLQWNAAVQYVFSNNLSFKGWKGYGGPDINNPYDDCTRTLDLPSDSENSNRSTMGFVMFGLPDGSGSWNYSYAYNETYGLDVNPDREKRYNYNVNFNGDHQAAIDRWHCGTCRNYAPDYNNNKHRFYPGISMEQEEDGWWKYTLTGVAQPGRTMIIFANYHEPWSQPDGDYTAEDNRWPGDYEAGLPLFDFEDNEGWFLFNGNTTIMDQKFTDDKPVSKVIPHKFTSAYNNKLRIGVKGDVSNITVNNVSVNRTELTNGISYFNVDNFNSSNASIPVIVNGKTYNLAPKNFEYKNGRYVTAKPLYLEFEDEINLFVKWNDHITGEYHPGTNGSNYLMVIYGTKNVTYDVTAKEYGNYKYVRFKAETPLSNKGQIQFKLPADNNFNKTLTVEKLPEYYIPDGGYYLINLHKMK